MAATNRLIFAFVVTTALGLGCLAQTNEPPGSAKTQPPPDPAPFLGCYELKVGRWWPFGFFGGDNEYVTPPRRIKLLSEHGTEGFEQYGFLIRALPPRKGENPGRGRPSYWLIQSDTKLDLIWFDGFSGVSLSLEKHGEQFRGRAHAHFDTHTLPRYQHVTAHRISCDAPQ